MSKIIKVFFLISALSILIFSQPKQKAMAQALPPTCNGEVATIWVDSETYAPAMAFRETGGGVYMHPYIPTISVIYGTAFDDVIVGGSENDTISALGGNDIVCGGAGNDQLIGGPGDDKLLGGDGDDQLAGGPGIDILYGGSGENTLSGGGTGGDLCYTYGTSPTSPAPGGCDVNPDSTPISLATTQLHSNRLSTSLWVIVGMLAMALSNGVFYYQYGLKRH